MAARAAVLIGVEDSVFAGGSYVVVQKYLHDLGAWGGLLVEEQERAFGRTKLIDVEFPDEQKAPDSHLALNTIVDKHGEQHEIVRFDMPFGHVGRESSATYFICYVRTPEVMEQCSRTCSSASRRATPTGILDFSSAVTGNLFFVPAADFLDDPPSPA